jgi:acylphosphatase
MKHYSIHIYGKVQGVFFRDSTRRKAHELELSGFVRNEPDGSVYIEAEGDEENLEIFKSWCHQGPPGANVERVEVIEGAIKNLEGFKIARQ